MDVAGDNQMKVEHNMLKQRLSAGTCHLLLMYPSTALRACLPVPPLRSLNHHPTQTPTLE